MRKKKLYPIIATLVLVVLFSMSLLYMGCKEGFQRNRGEEIVAAERLAEKEEELLAEKEEERLAKAEEEKKTETEQAATTEEEAKPNSSETINYSGIVNEATVILIVDLKTAEVTGSINLSGDDYIDAAVDGKINIDTFEIGAKYSGTGRLESGGEDYPVNGTINGKISDDLSLFKGIIKSDYEESGVEFTATKDD